MSELWRSFVRDGDTTTTGGRVDAKPQQWPVMYGDQHAAFEGDPVWCPACKSHGATKCVPPYRPSTGPDGRQKNLEGDLCLCRCPSPPRLIARINNVRAGFSFVEVSSMPGAGAWLAFAGHTIMSSSERVGPYNEQTRLNGQGAEGMPYHIETADGRMLSGKVDANGLLPRIETIGDVEYAVYWGDEALARSAGESS